MSIDLRHARRLLAQQAIAHPPFIVFTLSGVLGQAKVQTIRSLTRIAIDIVQKALAVLNINSLESKTLQPLNQNRLVRFARRATQIESRPDNSPQRDVDMERATLLELHAQHVLKDLLEIVILLKKQLHDAREHVIDMECKKALNVA